MVNEYQLEVCGVEVERIARLMRFLKEHPSAERSHVTRQRNHRIFRAKVFLYGLELHVVDESLRGEHKISLRGSRWKLEFETSDTLMFVPSDVKSSKQAYYGYVPAAIPYTGYLYRPYVSSANSFKHDMTILLMFESEWQT